MSILVRNASKINFEDILEHYGLKGKRQNDQVMINCPLPNHKDENPSCGINLEKNVFHCFGCNSSGGVIKFVQLMENFEKEEDAAKWVLSNFTERIKREYELSDLNVELVEKEDIQETLKNLKRIYKIATQFYHVYAPIEKYKYWESRLKPATILQYKLGYIVPGLFSVLRAAEFTDGQLLKYGLVYENGMDVQVGRYTIPFFENGEVVNIQTRVAQGYEGPKYLPLIPHRKVRLYNVDILKDCKHYVILTEGAVDCLSLVERGFNAVGIPGIMAMMDDWKQYFFGGRTIYVCFDTEVDEKKQKSMVFAIERLKKFFDKFQFIRLPEVNGKKMDVNEYFLSGSTTDDFKELMAKAETIYGNVKYTL